MKKIHFFIFCLGIAILTIIALIYKNNFLVKQNSETDNFQEITCVEIQKDIFAFQKTNKQLQAPKDLFLNEELTVVSKYVLEELKKTMQVNFIDNQDEIESDNWKKLKSIKILGDIDIESLNIDISECENIWIQNVKEQTQIQVKEIGKEKILPKKMLNDIQNSCNLKQLYLGNVELPKDIHELDLKSEILETFAIEGVYSDITNIKFNSPNLKNCSFGNETAIKNLDNIGNIENLKNFSFGSFIKDAFIAQYGFEEVKEKIISKAKVDSNEIAIISNTIITDIKGLKKAKNLEILNISALKSITSEQLYDLISELPNLKKIVGLEIDNSFMYSDELTKLCSDRHIENSFTQKSKEINSKTKEILKDLNLENKTEKEKIKAIVEYVINNMEYSADLGNVLDKINGNKELTEIEKDIIKNNWGEKLSYALNEGKGVCDGYETLTRILLLQAGIKVYRQENYMHTWNLVEIEENGDKQYYQIDTTRLDNYCLENNIQEISEELPFFLTKQEETYYQIPIIKVI